MHLTWPDQADCKPPHVSRHVDDDVCSDRECRRLKSTYASGNPYDCSLLHLNGSNSCAVCAIGIDISTRVVTVWHQSKASIKRLLNNEPPETRTAHESTCRVPHDIVEMILTHLNHDLGTLKACSLTCRSWYTVTLPHLFYTLTLRRDKSSFIGDKLGVTSSRDRLKPLSRVHERGLTPLVKSSECCNYTLGSCLRRSVTATYATFPLSPTFRPLRFIICGSVTLYQTSNVISTTSRLGPDMARH